MGRFHLGFKRAAVFAAYAGAAGALHADIRPLTGQWQGDVQLTGYAGCPHDVVSGAASDGGYGPRYIAFPDVFDGSAIPGDFTWLRVAENHWRAQQTQSQTTPMGALRLSFTHDLHVDSETAMTQLSRLHVTFPQAMAQMLGTGANCTISSRVDHRRVGD